MVLIALSLKPLTLIETVLVSPNTRTTSLFPPPSPSPIMSLLQVWRQIDALGHPSAGRVHMVALFPDSGADALRHILCKSLNSSLLAAATWCAHQEW